MTRPLPTALALCLLAMVFSFAHAGAQEDAAPQDVQEAFDNLRSLWASGSADGIVRQIGDRVNLHLDDQATGNYSRKQATPVLREYFQRTQIDRVEHKKFKGSGASWSEECKYEYRLPGEQEPRRAKLYLQIRNVDGRWILQEARVY